MQSREKKIVKQNFKDCVKAFFKGKFEKGLSHLKKLNADLLTDSEYKLFCKINQLYLLGQLVDLPTLHSILTYHGIKSNACQVNFNKLISCLSNHKIIEIYQSILQNNAKKVLEGIKRYAPLVACIGELMKELLQEKIT